MKSERKERYILRARKALERRLDGVLWPGVQGLSLLLVGRFFIEAVTKMNFIHAMIISVMEGIDIMVSDELLAKLVPDVFGEDEMEDDQFHEGLDGLEESNEAPIDQNILLHVSLFSFRPDLKLGRWPKVTVEMAMIATLPVGTRPKMLLRRW